MTNTRPTVDPDCRYNQQQTAEALQVDRRTVRRWELEGHISFKTHKASRRKFTTGKQILKCWEACYLFCKDSTFSVMPLHFCKHLNYLMPLLQYLF